MPRPRFELADEQASMLVRLIPSILDQHPAGARDYRSFAHEFVGAVYQATGKTFSPSIYHRLLRAYAPGRMPSSSTLAIAKRHHDEKLKPTKFSANPDAGDVATIAQSMQVMMDTAQALTHALEDAGRRVVSESASDRRAQMQIQQLQGQLLATEQRANEARAHAARLAADLKSAQALVKALQAEVDASRNALAENTGRIERMAEETASLRKTMMMAIDGVRGETRAWQERCKSVEDQLQRSKQHLEVFRQLAYQRGAKIPADLVEEGSK